jgi:hypothetical protein
MRHGPTEWLGQSDRARPEGHRNPQKYGTGAVTQEIARGASKTAVGLPLLSAHRPQSALNLK